MRRGRSQPVAEHIAHRQLLETSPDFVDWDARPEFERSRLRPKPFCYKSGHLRLAQTTCLQPVAARPSPILTLTNVLTNIDDIIQ